jgi:tetratricopeptide (TPR) repeat protein
MFTNLLITCSVLATAYIIAFVFVPLWRKRHDAEKGLYARTQEDNKLSVDYALKQLNCKPKWTNDHDTLQATYMYQSGKFRMMLEKDSPYVKLFYLFFFQADIDKLEWVRTVCNRCNLTTETCRLIYTVDSAKGVVDLHVMAGLLITDSTVTEVLERAMTNIFAGRDVFIHDYNEMESQQAGHDLHDPEAEDAENKRVIFLLREQEMMHQDEGPDWHLDLSKVFAMRQLLSTTLALNDVVPVQLTIVQGRQLTVKDDPDAALDYNLMDLMTVDGKPATQGAFMKLDFYDPGNPVRQRHLTLDLEPEGSSDAASYFRATLTLSPLSLGKDAPANSKPTEKRTVSVLLGVNKMSEEKIREKFRYIWKEAMARQKAGQQDKLTEEERLLVQVQDPKMSICLDLGHQCFLQERYHEAIFMLQSVFKYLQRQQIQDDTEKYTDVYASICFMLGTSFSALQEYDRALFYLEIAFSAHRIDYTTSYVNALVNSHDPRALTFIEMLINTITPNEEDEEMPEHLEPFMQYLLRQQASVLVDQKRFEEAEKLLKSMLDDPANSDFALKELAHIQKLKGE